jgi:tetratricopeptide (TPR) repeat protein
MNVDDYIYLINKPDAIKEKQADALGTVLNEFPYFQSARALRLKGLYNQKSFKYNYALKVTAAHTTDRAVLFDFITSDTFTPIQKEYYDKKLHELHNITVFDSEIISSEEIKEIADTRIDPIERSILTSIKEATTAVFEKPETVIQESEIIENTVKVVEVEEITDIQIDPIEQSISTSIKEATTVVFEEPEKVIEEPEKIEEPIKITEVEEIEEVKEDLEINKPLDFLINEKHSFQEWLQLSRTQPIDRTNEIPAEEIKQIKNTIEPITEIVEKEKKKKAEIIDKFIENNPKISPIKSGSPVVSIQSDINKGDNSYLMTETLAKVYLEQKKYTKAIQAYEILILKYPEKISFFADRISDIKILQQNNNNN